MDFSYNTTLIIDHSKNNGPCIHKHKFEDANVYGT